VFISAVFQPPGQRRGERVRSYRVDDPAAGLFMARAAQRWRRRRPPM